MFHPLVDTCVWLDLAKDHRNQTFLRVLTDLIEMGEVRILLPRIVLDEIARNKDRIIREATRSLSGNFKLVKEVVWKVANDDQKELALSILNDVDYKVQCLRESIVETFQMTEAILGNAEVIEATEAVRMRAVERALEKRAPFHTNSNSMADAILIEIYADVVSKKHPRGHRFAFVTHNHIHFSQPKGNHNIPHPDLAPLFTKIKSMYFMKLDDALRKVKPDLVEELAFEHEGWEEPVRSMSEIIACMNDFCDKVWYNRHKNLEWKIKKGKVEIVEKETFPPPRNQERPIQGDVWARAMEAARRMEAMHGLENLGPWTDFEWGMLNGKLSALRWVLGDEWDMLDT